MVEPATVVILVAGIALLVTAIVAGVAIAFPPTLELSDRANYKEFLSSQRQKRSSNSTNTKKVPDPYRQPSENDHAKLL
jgi:hypothetical protein